MTAVTFSVTHRTRYRYSTDVRLGYNRAHLLPRVTPRQQVLTSVLAVDPPPDDRWDTLDADGNLLTYFSIEHPHRHLDVTARSEVTVAPGPDVPPPADVGWDRLAEELIQADAVALGPVLLGEARNVDGCRAEFQLGQRVQQRGGLLEAELFLAHPAGETVCLEDAHRGLVDQASAMDGSHHIVIAVQPPDEGNHGLGQRLTAHPRIKTRI